MCYIKKKGLEAKESMESIERTIAQLYHLRSIPAFQENIPEISEDINLLEVELETVYMARGREFAEARKIESVDKCSKYFFQ